MRVPSILAALQSGGDGGLKSALIAARKAGDGEGGLRLPARTGAEWTAGGTGGWGGSAQALKARYLPRKRMASVPSRRRSMFTVAPRSPVQTDWRSI